jgi:site-specific DNA recombinase
MPCLHWARYNRLQERIDAMYEDKLDGRITAEFFDRKAGEWRAEQKQILRSIEGHQTANENYMEEGIQLLELAQKAHRLFIEQEGSEKRRLLGFLVSNCSWKDGELSVGLRQSFDILADTVAAHEERKAAEIVSDGLSEIWGG